jgi:hypothetical protein
MMHIQENNRGFSIREIPTLEFPIYFDLINSQSPFPILHKPSGLEWELPAGCLLDRNDFLSLMDKVIQILENPHQRVTSLERETNLWFATMGIPVQGVIVTNLNVMTYQDLICLWLSKKYTWVYYYDRILNF